MWWVVWRRDDNRRGRLVGGFDELVFAVFVPLGEHFQP